MSITNMNTTLWIVNYILDTVLHLIKKKRASKEAWSRIELCICGDAKRDSQKSSRDLKASCIHHERFPWMVHFRNCELFILHDGSSIASAAFSKNAKWRHTIFLKMPPPNDVTINASKKRQCSPTNSLGTWKLHAYIMRDFCLWMVHFRNCELLIHEAMASSRWCVCVCVWSVRQAGLEAVAQT